MDYTLKQILGAALIDWPRFELGLRSSWVKIRNRSERIAEAPDGPGVACEWQWTSDLHVAKVFPSLGVRLMERSLHDWPISLADAPQKQTGSPQVSFIIGHRGKPRLPHLLETLRTIAAQRMIACECIVVEQSDEPEAQASLPAWVRYAHTKPREKTMPYSRSWALNAGARLATGPLLVFHDNDMLVPQDYAPELWRRFGEGYEAINLKRFIFYLDEAQTRRYFESGALDPRARSEAVVQNLEAGGSVAVGRDAFFSLGGFDESFVGWGGEDNEFWERALTRKAWPFGYLPIVHLRHAAQPRKQDPANPNLLRYRERAAVPPLRRIEELRAREFGRP